MKNTFLLCTKTTKRVMTKAIVIFIVKIVYTDKNWKK